MFVNKIKDITNRFYNLLLSPEKEWRLINNENAEEKKLFNTVIVSPCIALSMLTFLLKFLHTDLLFSVEWGLINLVACLAGAYITYIITKEFLSNKIDSYKRVSLNISLYSFAVYMVFRSLSVGLSGTFWGELLAVLSLSAIYTLYIGLLSIQELNALHRRNALIITGLLIICIPPFISRLLMIILSIPAINA